MRLRSHEQKKRVQKGGVWRESGLKKARTEQKKEKKADQKKEKQKGEAVGALRRDAKAGQAGAAPNLSRVSDSNPFKQLLLNGGNASTHLFGQSAKDAIKGKQQGGDMDMDMGVGGGGGAPSLGSPLDYIGKSISGGGASKAVATGGLFNTNTAGTDAAERKKAKKVKMGRKA